MARCPECNARLELPSDLELWDRVFCEACGVELEVIELNPIELEVAYEAEEDEEELELDDELDALDLDEDEEDWDEDEEDDEDDDLEEEDARWW